MNYLKELNAFYDFLEINSLSPSAINLWYALMHINNKARWAETFTVAESVLCVKTGLTDRTIRKVRNELKQKGRIDFVSRKGGRAPIYRMISFESTLNKPVVTSAPEINSAGSVMDSVTGDTGSSVVDSSALIKENKKEIKQNNNTTTRAHIFYKENFIKNNEQVPSHISDQINIWTKDFDEELIMFAMEIALERNKASWGYTKGILTDWVNKGIHTPSQAKNDQEVFKTNKKNKKPPFSSNSKNTKEIIPDWFREGKHRNHTTSTVEKISDQEVEDIRRRLKQFG